MVRVNSNGQGGTEEVCSEEEAVIAVSNVQRTASDQFDDQYPYKEHLKPQQMQLFSSQEDSAERTRDDDLPPSPALSSKMNGINDSIRKSSEAKNKPNFQSSSVLHKARYVLNRQQQKAD